MTIRVIDIETTGMDPQADGIVEIASVDVYKTPDGHDITSERQHLIFPGRDIPPAASAVHHILDEDVARSHRIEEVIADFNTANAYIAHNCAFERSFLDRFFGEDSTWVCTLKCALRIWPDAPGHSNQVLRYWLGLAEPFGRSREFISPHRALSDCIVTAAIFVKMTELAKWSQLVAWSAEPALYSTLTFGKHRGVKYIDAPADYLDWIAYKSDMDADTKYSAKHWIAAKAAKETA
jgi:exodeoxyribonuclease X